MLGTKLDFVQVIMCVKQFTIVNNFIKIISYIKKESKRIFSKNIYFQRNEKEISPVFSIMKKHDYNLHKKHTHVNQKSRSKKGTPPNKNTQ